MREHTALLVFVMSAVTVALRFLPFLVFRRSTPSYVLFLGEVLPAAIVGMLVVYCLKDVRFGVTPYGLPELIAGACVVLLQRWKRDSLLSILGGTVIYMILVQAFF